MTGTAWITTPLTAGLLRGALSLERTGRGVMPYRLPARARAQCPDPQIVQVASQPSGVRLAFRSAATAVELDVLPTKRAYVGAPPHEDGVYELLVDGRPAGRGTVPDAGDLVTTDLTTGAVTTQARPPGTLRFTGLPAGVKELELWLPHNETTELLALRTDAPVSPAPPAGRPVWLHHGSSISHGSDADRPRAVWPVLAASLAGVELVNLGLGGSALLDPFTARVLRDTPADLISVKLGINVVNLDLMRLRAFVPAVHGFLDTIREGHPAVPLLVVSPVLCPMHEDTPGPTALDFATASTPGGRDVFHAIGDPADVVFGKLTLRVIRAELARITAERAAEDPYLHYLDGRELYGEADTAAFPLPDGIHPDTATHRLIGERFATLALGKALRPADRAR